jgi:hypothetical protein
VPTTGIFLLRLPPFPHVFPFSRRGVASLTIFRLPGNSHFPLTKSSPLLLPGRHQASGCNPEPPDKLSLVKVFNDKNEFEHFKKEEGDSEGAAGGAESRLAVGEQKHENGARGEAGQRGGWTRAGISLGRHYGG